MKDKTIYKSINDRQEFLKFYSDFDDVLKIIGFRRGHYWEEAATPLDCNYWINEIDCLYGVEHYVNDTLNFSIRFLRDRNTHLIYEVGGLFQRTIGIPLEEYQNTLLKECERIKTLKLKQLNQLIF